VKIEPGLYLFLAAAVLVLPLRLVIAWALAVTIHELSHYLALKLCGIIMRNIRISVSGIMMQVEELNGWKEIICSLAGPAGGLHLLLLSRWLPCTAICGLLHSCYNLLPIFSLDGGRAFKVVLIKLLGMRTGNKVHYFISCGLIAVLAIAGVYLCLCFDLILWPLLFVGILLALKCVRKFPCKPLKQIVQ